MERQLGNKTRLTVEEGCVRSYQCCSSQKIFNIRVEESCDHDIDAGFAAKHTNSFPKEPAHLQLTILAFCLTFRRLVHILAKDDATPTKSACIFMHTP